jgi:glycosyltransferase involved in cell wall biosynthesis
MDLVSIIIPCYNPSTYLLDALSSARNQTHTETEIVLVDDGSDQGQSVLKQAAGMVDRYLSQPNCGLPAARNAAIRAAVGRYVVPLDQDDIIQPEYVATCLASLEKTPDAAFAYTAYKVFGTASRLELPGEYNLYRLLDRNFLTYAALIRKQDWEQAGGYDQSMRFGYEDWEFWLSLGARDRFGIYVPQPLFRYRKHGPSLYDIALGHHAEIVSYIRKKHPELYSYESRGRLKARWSPSVTVIGPCPSVPQSILDIEIRRIENGHSLSQGPLAPALLLCESGALDSHSAELAALAVWVGRTNWPLLDGSLALAREDVPNLKRTKPGQVQFRSSSRDDSSLHPKLRRYLLWQHLANAGLLSMDAWLKNPLRSALRLIPLRIKERINKTARHQVFDLSYYLQFQPDSLFVDEELIERLSYFPRPAAGRSRIALITPHLGPGGAESVLLDIASALDPARFELFLLATQSRNDRWLDRWRGCVEHIYDLAAVAPPERVCSAVFTIVTNWRCDALLVQNSLPGYAAIPHIKREYPETKVLDLVHALDDRWDQISALANIAPHIDVRITGCEAVRRRLLESGEAPEKVNLIRNGVDLRRFKAPPARCSHMPLRILFAGRLDPVKRPLLLVKIAANLTVIRKPDFQFVVAGDGPDRDALQQSTHRSGLETIFEFRGYVPNLTPLFEESDVCVLTSRSEGIPLVVLEAMAASRPVVASNVGGVAEVLDSSCGVLIDVGPNEAHLFAAAINTLLGQPGLREEMGAAGRRKIEAEYDLYRIREAYIHAFSALVEPGKIPPPTNS